MIKNGLLLAVLLITWRFSHSQTVTIGTQVWMTKNLDVDKFRNGDPIPQARTGEEWEWACMNEIPAWCFYENNPENGIKYGRLYNVYAVNDPRGLAPQGWHIPSDSEWKILEDYLGNKDTEKKLKSSTGWNSWDDLLTCSNCENWKEEIRNKKKCTDCKDTRVIGKKTHSGNGNNFSGFSALPGGFRYNTDFLHIGNHGYWWSVEIYSDYYSIYNDDEYLFSNRSSDFPFGTTGGLSVRCIKD
jgi:hypothetical protein